MVWRPLLRNRVGASEVPSALALRREQLMAERLLRRIKETGLAHGGGQPAISGNASETEIADQIAALVFQHERAFQPLQRLLGIFVAEVGGALIIGLGGG